MSEKRKERLVAKKGKSGTVFVSLKRLLAASYKRPKLQVRLRATPVLAEDDEEEEEKGNFLFAKNVYR